MVWAISQLETDWECKQTFGQQDGSFSVHQHLYGCRDRNGFQNLFPSVICLISTVTQFCETTYLRPYAEARALCTGPFLHKSLSVFTTLNQNHLCKKIKIKQEQSSSKLIFFLCLLKMSSCRSSQEYLSHFGFSLSYFSALKKPENCWFSHLSVLIFFSSAALLRFFSCRGRSHNLPKIMSHCLSH